MTTWALDFESRDFRFLAQESGILPTLQAMVTLTNTAGMASSALARLGVVDNERPEEIIGQENSMPARQRWTPWSLDSVREGFVQVSGCVGVCCVGGACLSAAQYVLVWGIDKTALFGKDPLSHDNHHKPRMRPDNFLWV